MLQKNGEEKEGNDNRIENGMAHQNNAWNENLN